MNKAFLIIIGVIIGVCISFIPRACKSNQKELRATLAGQELPSKGIQINFDGLVDIYLKPYSGSDKSPRIISRCKILGVVGSDGGTQGTSSWKGGYHFENWVCLQLEDGNRMFTPLSDIEYFIEIKEDKNPG